MMDLSFPDFGLNVEWTTNGTWMVTARHQGRGPVLRSSQCCMKKPPNGCTLSEERYTRIVGQICQKGCQNKEKGHWAIESRSSTMLEN